MRPLFGVQGMLTHSEHAGVQYQASDVLGSLAAYIEAVVSAREARKARVLVQEHACHEVGAVVPRSARQPEAVHQDIGRCGMCQARRQRQQHDSKHQERSQRSPRQA